MSHDAHSHELPFWRKYIFSTDHKIIGLQYGITALLFLLFGFALILIMRWQLAYPDQAIGLPFLNVSAFLKAHGIPALPNLFESLGNFANKVFGEDNMPGGVVLPNFYNQLVAMHATIMVW